MRTRAFAGLLAVCGLAFGASAQPHGDIEVGVSGAGKLKIEADLDEAFYLPPFSGGGINGWFGDDPGFESLDHDEPDEDFFMLAPGADIYFVLVSADPAFKVYDPFFNLLGPGDSFALGGHDFDVHPFYHIDSDDAAFDPLQTEWKMSFRLRDLGTTGYDTSDEYVVVFTNIPAPAPLALLALAGAGAARRRRA